MEGRLSLGEEVDLDSYGRAASHLRRILETLGLERKARDALTLDSTAAPMPFSPMKARWSESAKEPAA